MYVGVPTQSQSLPSAARGQAAADPAQHANSTASADAPVPKRRPQLMRSPLLPLRAAKHVAGKLSIGLVTRAPPAMTRMTAVARRPPALVAMRSRVRRRPGTRGRIVHGLARRRRGPFARRPVHLGVGHPVAESE